MSVTVVGGCWWFLLLLLATFVLYFGTLSSFVWLCRIRFNWALSSILGLCLISLYSASQTPIYIPTQPFPPRLTPSHNPRPGPSRSAGSPRPHGGGGGGGGPRGPGAPYPRPPCVPPPPRPPCGRPRPPRTFCRQPKQEKHKGARCKKIRNRE